MASFPPPWTANAVPKPSRPPSVCKHQNLFQLSPAANASSHEGKVRSPRVLSCPTTDGAFSLHCHFLAVGVCPVSFRRFAFWLSFFVPPRSTGVLLMFLFFRLVRSSIIVGVSVVEKMLLRPLPRVRASCARASRVSNNCLHLFTQCAQPLDMGCFAVKANCLVLRFTFLSDRCKALSFSEIR